MASIYVACPGCDGEKEYDAQVLPPEPDVGLFGWGADVWQVDGCLCVLLPEQARAMELRAQEIAIEPPEYDY